MNAYLNMYSDYYEISKEKLKKEANKKKLCHKE